MEFPRRKQNRLTEFAYNTPGAYFLTACTANRKNIFWCDVGAAIGRPQDVVLSPYGMIVDQIIRQIPTRYPGVSVDHYVIMPNHIHLLLQIHTDDSGRAMHAPTISTVVQQMKGTVSKQIGFSIWQKGFYDHVIRTDDDYREIWEYIDGNPAKWMEDRLCKDLIP